MTDLLPVEAETAAPPAAPWWRYAVIYQIYPRSFADASGDGVGDLPGITARLDHLAQLGVDAVWLSPFYTSPQADAGYDVADYRDVDPLFGSLADFDALLAEAHALGLRVIVDVVPNHTSDEHAWFQAALAAAPGSPERARYVFRDGRGEHGELPPNNWGSVFGGRAWTRVTEPDGRPAQWYLHLFDTRQPDLDWSNPQVRSEFHDVLRFWLDRGVDGFRVDVAHGLVKEPGLPDWSGESRMIEGEAHTDVEHEVFGDQGPMWDQDGVHEIWRGWRAVLDSYEGDRAMVAEAWVPDPQRLAHYLRPDEYHQAFNFDFLVTGWDAGPLRRVIDHSMTAAAGVGAPTTWVLSNHDVVRHFSRLGLPETHGRPNGIAPTDVQPDEALGQRRGRAASLLMLALPGSAYVYQGEELGLPEHTTMAAEVRQDPSFFRTKGAETGRDGCRVPIPWVADAPGHGFGPTGATWLPQPASYATYAADQQVGVEGSTFETYRAALRLRREHGLGLAQLSWLDLAGDAVAFRVDDVTVVTNTGSTPVPLPEGRVLLASVPDAVGPDGLRPDTTVWLA